MNQPVTRPDDSSFGGQLDLMHRNTNKADSLFGNDKAFDTDILNDFNFLLPQKTRNIMEGESGGSFGVTNNVDPILKLSDPNNQKLSSAGTISGGDSNPAPFSNLNDKHVLHESESSGKDTGSTARLSVSFDRTTSYFFSGSMSEDVMHRYLDRALVMNFLADWYPGAWGGVGPVDDRERDREIAMILDLNPKYVGGLVAFTGGLDWHFRWQLGKLKYIISNIHLRDVETICEAYIPEFIDSVEIEIPDYVRAEFELDNPLHPNNVANGWTRHPDNFNYTAMRYTHPIGGQERNLDVTRYESQIWIFFLATQYIEVDCEAISFGDIWTITHNDHGFKSMWSVLQRIRKYARINARRGVILMTSHVFQESGQWNPNSRSVPDFAYYHDPMFPDHGETWERELLFDYHGLGILYEKPDGWQDHCDDRHFFESTFPVVLKYGAGLLDRSLGGINPQGWLCVHNPVLLLFDFGPYEHGELPVKLYGWVHHDDPTSSDPYRALHGYMSYDVVGELPTHRVGCDPLTDEGNFYGYDNSSWFVAQSKVNRDKILEYTYYKIKCLDPYAHFLMPGRIPYRELYAEHISIYRAINGTTVHTYVNSRGQTVVDSFDGNQQTTIKRIWDDYYAGPNDWTFHNFTIENVLNEMSPPVSSLIFVGSNRKYFIGLDGNIWAYIHLTGNYNGGTWSTMSPTIESGISVKAVVDIIRKREGDLVASPDGSLLLFIGSDSQIHGFNVIDAWTYSFFTWGGDPDIKVDSCLIFPSNDRVYYIGINRHDNTRQVHGFIARSPGIWETVSPSYAADAIGIRDGVIGQRVFSHIQPSGALTYDVATDRIYYRGIDGHLYYFMVHSLTYYSYHNPIWANNKLAIQKLKIVGELAIYKNRIYYVGRYLPNGDDWIHCLYEDPVGSGIWDTVSPSYSGDLSTQIKSNKDGKIAVSPDGRTIAYFGKNWPYICYYHNIDNVRYTFHTVYKQVDATSNWPINEVTVPSGCSLKFIGNDIMFYISLLDKKVHYLKFQECYCINPALYYWPGF